MLLFQNASASFVPSYVSYKPLSYQVLKEEAKNMVLPEFIETSIRGLAGKIPGVTRDALLAIIFQSMELTADELKQLKNVKWGPEDQKIMAKITNDIKHSDFADGMPGSTSNAMKNAGLPAKKAEVQDFVASHIENMAVSFLLKVKATHTDDRALTAKDIDHAEFNVSANRASFTLCFTNVACFPMDLLKMKDDPDKASQMASFIANGKINKAHVTEIFGANGWNNLQVIASAIYKAFAKSIYLKPVQYAYDGFIQYAQNDVLRRQDSEASEEQKSKAKEIVHDKGGFGRGGFFA